MTTEPSPVEPQLTTADPLAASLVSAVPEFSALPGDAKPDIDQINPSSTRSSDWNAAKHAALVQAQLARRLIWVLAGVLAGGGGLLATVKWTGLTAHDVTDFFGVAFGAVVTLTTAATSFWFGSQSERVRRQNESG
jgi:hypothetical protein